MIMAKAVRYSEFGGPEVLELVDIEVPEAGPGEVVVQVRAAGVNPIDWKIRGGQRSNTPLEKPVGIGFDASGVVHSVGTGVTGFAPGDAVIGVNLSGAYASHVVATPANLTHKPAEVGFEEAAGLGIPAATAYQALKSLGVKAGDTLLVHAGSGAVGQAAVQLARLWGATVVATASEPNHARLHELGAIPVAYGDGLLERVRAAAPSGVDVALDCAGTDEALDVSVELVADRQRIGTIVITQRAKDAGIQFWTSSVPGSLTDEQRQLRVDAIPYVAELAARGEFEVQIAERYPLELAAEAHRRSETGHVRGKLVLVP
jgi:NADPH:quinone reductase-like Zn-dependent oxidoreductase